MQLQNLVCQEKWQCKSTSIKYCVIVFVICELELGNDHGPVKILFVFIADSYKIMNVLKKGTEHIYWLADKLID